ncbi:Serine/threonine-protein phosphatase [Quillaja saponaria]|uniref:Serine/threonine-protein phosphatase n=1 Tax=Quillaja saponaria TaxID=32244 RepID=A0AAD7L2M4_QUISA|nr:Serine/threonine-protein phosphatase [Quillaja saponaria]
MLYVKRVRPHDPPLACALEDGLVEDIALVEHGDDVHCNHAHVVGHESYSEGDGHDFPPGPLACRWRGVRILTEVSKHVLKQYRFQLDNLSSKQMVWQPYTDDVVHSLPDFCFSGRDIWRAVVPLICFHIIEWHQPDRVMRQFGLQQSIPKLPKQEDHLHKIDLRGRFNFDWHQHHKRFIEIWSQRASFVVVGQPLDGPLGYHSEYMTWFRGITRRWMSPGGAVLEVVADGLEKIHRLSRPGASMIDIQQIQETCSSLFYAMDEHRHLMDVNESHPVQQVQHLPIPYVAEDRLDPPKRPKKSGLAIHRRRVEPLKTVTTCRKQLQPLKLVASTCRSSQVQPSQPLAIAEADSTHPRPSTSSFSSLLSSSAPHPPPQLKLPVSWPANRKLDLDWIQNLMACLDWSSRNLTPVQFPVVLPVNVLESLILCASEMLQKEPNCLKIDPSHPNSNSDVDQIYNIIVVGDIHGQLHDLLFLLQDAGYPSPNSIFVFNGDYVDRGAWGLETFLLLLALKVFMPYNIYLLRGSHESKFYTTTYGFEKEVLAKYGDKGKQVYQKCLKCFANLPLASIIAGCVYTTHGGLFRSEALLPSEKRPKGRKNRKIIFNCDSNSLSLGSLEELLKARRLLPDPPSEGPNFILGDVLWSDPLATPSLSSNKKRGVGLFWGPNCTEEFLEKHNLKLIIRSHEGPDAREKRDGFAGMDEGYTIDHSVKSGKLITVFSAPDYPQFQATEHRYNNKGAYVVLKPPNFDIPEFHSFEAVTPRPQVK